MISAASPIGSVEELREHLQYAVGLELTTIPAYLCAMYTIEDGTNTAAYDTIQSVVLEEMLHMVLAANVLNAVGGVPATGPVGDGPSPIPVYPTEVPFISEIPLIHLQRFSPEAIDEFIDIERPDDLAAAAHGDQYASIGSFYAAIETGLRSYATPEVFEAARESRAGCQLRPSDYYGGAGTVIEVTDLDSAVAALTEIVREGEGVSDEALSQTAHEHLLSGAQTPGRLPPGIGVDDLDTLPFGWKMYSHFARFSEIRAGRTFRPEQTIDQEPAGSLLVIDWDSARPMITDPRSSDYDGTDVHGALVAANETYTELVDAIYRAVNGDSAQLQEAVATMYRLKYQAIALTRTPSPLEPGKTLGPPFEYLGSAG